MTRIPLPLPTEPPPPAFRPEPLAEMRARYHAAVAEPFDAEPHRLGWYSTPMDRRANLFDCDPGIRIVMWREVTCDEDRFHVAIRVCGDGVAGSTLCEALAQKFSVDAPSMGSTFRRLIESISGRRWAFPDRGSVQGCWIFWSAPWHQPITHTGGRRRRPRPLRRRGWPDEGSREGADPGATP